jgi:hypothetical protein
MPTKTKLKNRIRRLEFRITGDPDVFIIFEKHFDTPFWQSEENGICFVYTKNLNYTAIKAFVKSGKASRTIFPSSHAEFKRYQKIALAHHTATASMLAALPRQ